MLTCVCVCARVRARAGAVVEGHQVYNMNISFRDVFPSMKILTISCFPRCTLSCSRLSHKCFTSDPSMPFFCCVVCSSFTDVAAFNVQDSLTTPRPAFSLQGKFPLVLTLNTDLSADQHLPARASLSLWLLSKSCTPQQCCASALSHVRLCDSVDCSPQAPLSMGVLQARILEWTAMPSSRGSSQPRHQTQVSFTAGRFFTIWATREAHAPQ